MKYVFILIAATLVIFVACKKHITNTNCYACYQYDSLYRNGYLAFYNGHNDTLCGYTDGMARFFMLSHVHYDTFNRGTDTPSVGYSTWRCSILK